MTTFLNKSFFIFILISTIFICSAFWLQNHLMFNSDVSYLLYVTKLLFSGKTYVTDFFETNPPMIFYLYSPVVAFSKNFHLNLSLTLFFYIAILSCISISIIFYFLKKIQTPSFVLYGLLSVLFFLMLCFPTTQFGQREHLFFILTLPYFFAASVQSKNGFLSVWIGLLAGLGFALKPYFLLPLVFVESYFILKSRSFLGWVRIESFVVLCVLVVYLLTTIYFFQTYFTVVLPLINLFYFSSIRVAWSIIFSNSYVLFSMSVLIASVFFLFKGKIKNRHSEHLKIILTLALAGYIAMFLVTHTAWFYHIIPAVSLACVLLSIYYFEFFNLNKHKKGFCIFAGIVLFFIPLINFSLTSYVYVKDQTKNMQQDLLNYFSLQKKEKSIMCLSVNMINNCFPLIPDSHNRYGSRYPFFWWGRGLVLAERNQTLPKKILLQNKNYLIQSVVDDLSHYQVNWIIINKKYASLGNGLSIIDYFSQNRNFQNAFKKYHYQTTVGDYVLYSNK